jgi:hypothetical protein
MIVLPHCACAHALAHTLPLLLSLAFDDLVCVCESDGAL